jgi:Zn-dependent protease
MTQLHPGGYRLFRLFGIDVHVHWMWILVAFLMINWRREHYNSLTWNVLEYLSLFGIVLLHEFGHALACRSVGGRADRIMLWLLGGVAFVQPPPRPGAHLWSIAAGPLVNVVLLPLTIIPAMLVRSGQLAVPPDLAEYIIALAFMNVILLVFNMLPIYPLDGGQILRSLLWFVLGPARSLMVATSIGLVGAAGVLVLVLAVFRENGIWLGILALFVGMQSWAGFRAARSMQRISALPRHRWARCPECGENPVAGDYWGCPCGQKFDIFASGFRCPGCGGQAQHVSCPHCGKPIPSMLWSSAELPR